MGGQNTKSQGEAPHDRAGLEDTIKLSWCFRVFASQYSLLSDVLTDGHPVPQIELAKLLHWSTGLHACRSDRKYSRISFS